MPTALVLGASRGLGLEFAKQYLADGWRVYATHRAEADRVRLRDLGAQTLALDVLAADDLAGLAWQLEGERIDVAVVNAGVYGPRDSHPQHPPTNGEFDLVMHTNVLAPMRLLPRLAPLIGPARGTLAFMSSRMGSISATGAGHGMLYRVSKAAENMVARARARRAGRARRARARAAPGVGAHRHGRAQRRRRGAGERGRHAARDRRRGRIPGRRLLRLPRAVARMVRPCC
ncbi:MAG: SDR family NAD(P)-dependent oxidoreductase [Burkholderiaceae bacterium]|nr:SDR family NAD(P)-dependent oxidoreductase [Burkholderiaceae bacterium]